ncbi:hypothetical protein D9M72_497010 [compost metagenome]
MLSTVVPMATQALLSSQVATGLIANTSAYTGSRESDGSSCGRSPNSASDGVSEVTSIQ